MELIHKHDYRNTELTVFVQEGSLWVPKIKSAKTFSPFWNHWLESNLGYIIVYPEELSNLV